MPKKERLTAAGDDLERLREEKAGASRIEAAESHAMEFVSNLFEQEGNEQNAKNEFRAKNML